MSEAACRIRLKLPSGAEIEAEGGEEFVKSEAQRLLAILETPAARAQPDASRAVWNEVAEPHPKGLVLRSKASPGMEQDACLLLLGAARALLSQTKPTATQLASWLRLSGTPVKRMDRILNEAVRKGDILASGARRSRRYELTAAGVRRANLQAVQLAHTRLEAP